MAIFCVSRTVFGHRLLINGAAPRHPEERYVEFVVACGRRQRYMIEK
jgi:hypothetical protein